MLGDRRIERRGDLAGLAPQPERYALVDAAPLRLREGGVGNVGNERILEAVGVVGGSPLQEVVALDV